MQDFMYWVQSIGESGGGACSANRFSLARQNLPPGTYRVADIAANIVSHPPDRAERN